MDQVPFNRAEVETGLLYDAGTPRAYPQFKSPISPRENWRRAMRLEKPLWAPMRTDCLNFLPRCIPDNVARVFVLDGNPPVNQTGGKDMFGVDWVYIPVAMGSMVRPGKPMLSDISAWRETIRFPDIEQWDWAHSAEISKAYRDTDRVLEGWQFTGFFERLISFMDFENAAVAMIDDEQKPHVHALFQAITDLYKKIIRKQKEFFHLDMLCFHDDWGGQTGPFFSLETCREMLVPYFRQIIACCHEHDILFNFHNCGKNEKLFPAIAEMGADGWSGQAINDTLMLHEKYGDKVMISIRPTLEPTASDAEIDDYARWYVETFWPDMQERPVYLDDTRPNPRLRTRIYELSRTAG